MPKNKYNYRVPKGVHQILKINPKDNFQDLAPKGKLAGLPSMSMSEANMFSVLFVSVLMSHCFIIITY